METRRQFLSVVVATLGLGPIVVWIGSPSRVNQPMSDDKFPIQKTDEQWEQTLTPEEYHVLREHGTERAFTSPLNVEKRDGMFVCAGCGAPLFPSDTKFDSGTGWPSFFKPLDDAAVQTDVDRSYYMVRTEVHCAKCGGHLGHVFDDGPKPTGLRYCMNGAALKFEPKTS